MLSKLKLSVRRKLMVYTIRFGNVGSKIKFSFKKDNFLDSALYLPDRDHPLLFFVHSFYNSYFIHHFAHFSFFVEMVLENSIKLFELIAWRIQKKFLFLFLY